MAAVALALGAACAAPAAAQRPSGATGDSVTAAIGHGDLARSQGAWERAIDAYRWAQALLGLHLLYGPGDRFHYEESAAIYRGLAEAYLAAGDPYAAGVEAARAVNLVEDDARLWTLLGLARYRTGEVAGAAEALARAIELDDAGPDAHWGLALVAVALNRIGEARRRGERALALAPRPRYALGLAKWAAAEGDYRSAAVALDTYVRLAPDDPVVEGHRRLARFWAEVGREPANRIDQRVTRVQANFDLKPGDEIPYLPVRFNGHAPVYVLIDTGAERNVVDREYARSIGIGPIRPGGPLHGAYRQSPGGYAIVDSLTLGSARIERIPFAVGDFDALNLRAQGAYYIAGVVNPAILARDFLVVLDYGHRRLELVRYDAGGEGYVRRRTRIRKTATPFYFDANGVWPVLPVSLDGARPLPFLADTGASDLLVARPTAAALRLDPLRFVAAAGGHVAENLRAILLDGTPGERWGMDLHGVLGFPFFRGMRVVFDYREMTMVLEN